MINNYSIKLHPRNYKELDGRLIFYFREKMVKSEDFEAILHEIRSAKTLVITSFKKNEFSERYYALYIGRYVLYFDRSDNNNFRCTKVLFGKKPLKKKRIYIRQRFLLLFRRGESLPFLTGRCIPKIY